MKWIITVEGDNNDKTRDKKLILKSNALFRSCSAEISMILIDNVEDLDIVMIMYNLSQYLLEDSEDYSMTSGSFWNCNRDEVNDGMNENNAANNRTNNSKTIRSKSFE